MGVQADLGGPVRRKINVTPTRFEIAAIGLYKKVTFRYARNLFKRQNRRSKTSSRGRYPFRPYDFARLAFRLIARVVRSPRWEVTPDERMDIVDFYRPSNLRFREKLGEQAHSAEWTEWFHDGRIGDT